MNVNNKLYNDYLKISNDWPLDDWSITKECFDKIVEILPFDKTILEIGSGKSTDLLSKFYNLISLESNVDWMNKYNSKYIYVPLKKIISKEFGETEWLDVDVVEKNISNVNYDFLLVDAGGDRVGIYDYIHFFKTDNIPIIFDDTMCEPYLKCAELLSTKLKKSLQTFQCKQNKYCVNWWGGKKYTLLR